MKLAEESLDVVRRVIPVNRHAKPAGVTHDVDVAREQAAVNLIGLRVPEREDPRDVLRLVGSYHFHGQSFQPARQASTSGSGRAVIFETPTVWI